MTETGYRSHFTHPDPIEREGGPAEFALAWLEAEADSRQWHERRAKASQLELF